MEMFTYAAIVVIFMVFAWYQTQKRKEIGSIGEKIVADKLNELGSDFVVLNNARYKKCQIDHLVISHDLKLVFVIETKMWSGDITGDVNDTMWKQHKDGQVNYLNNPMKQNKYHCSRVRQKYYGYNTKSIVVFVGCKSIPHYDTVMRADDVVKYIEKVSNKVSNRVLIDGKTDWLSQRL